MKKGFALSVLAILAAIGGAALAIFALGKRKKEEEDIETLDELFFDDDFEDYEEDVAEDEKIQDNTPTENFDEDEVDNFSEEDITDEE